MEEQIAVSVELNEQGEKFILKQRPAVVPPPEVVTKQALIMRKQMLIADIQRAKDEVKNKQEELELVKADLELIK